MQNLSAALYFLIQTLFDLYSFILMIRVILVFVGANYFDPLTQFIIKMTDFIINPLRKFIPNIKNIETASVILILILQCMKYFLLIILFGAPISLLSIFIFALFNTIRFVLEVFFYAILLQAILSWIQPYSPFHRVLQQITAPILRPFQRLIPLVNGFDISPIPALIILQLLIILLSPLG